MSESIAIGLKRAAIVLGDELHYARAAERLNITAAELQERISELETQLCFHIFNATQEKVELTEEGRYLVNAFRESIALHDRHVSKGLDEKS